MKVKRAVSPLILFTKKNAFRMISEDACGLMDKEEQLCEAIVALNARTVFKGLQKMMKMKEGRKEIQRKEVTLGYMRGLGRWKESTRKGKALKIMGSTLKRIYIR